MNEKTSKLAFWQVGRGRLASEVQSLFEQAQIEARERNATVTVALKINVHPPESSDSRFGKISYNTHMKVPEKKSMEFTTELIDGVIVTDGKDEADILQIKLALEFPENVKPFEGQERTVSNG